LQAVVEVEKEMVVVVELAVIYVPKLILQQEELQTLSQLVLVGLVFLHLLLELLQQLDVIQVFQTLPH
jgi:hypothetical protein